MCWPSSGAGRRTAPGRVGELHRDAERADRALDRVVDRHLHLARLGVLVGEHLGVVVDRPARHAALDERGDPLVGAARRERRFELGDEVGDVGHPVVVGGEAGVVDGRSSRPIAAHSRSNSGCVLPPTVMYPSAVRSAWYGAVSRCAEPSLPGTRPVAHSSARLPDRQRQRALEQRRVDVLPAAGALARVQRRQDRDRAEQPGGQVADRDPALDRVAVGLAGDAHHARRAPARSGRSPAAASTARSGRSRRSRRRRAAG